MIDLEKRTVANPAGWREIDQLRAAANSLAVALKDSLAILDQLREQGQPVQIEQAEAKSALAQAARVGIVP